MESFHPWKWPCTEWSVGSWPRWLEKYILMRTHERCSRCVTWKKHVPRLNLSTMCLNVHNLPYITRAGTMTRQTIFSQFRHRIISYARPPLFVFSVFWPGISDRMYAHGRPTQSCVLPLLLLVLCPPKHIALWITCAQLQVYWTTLALDSDTARTIWGQIWFASPPISL